MHAGEAELRVGDYYGSVVNRAARLTSVDALVWTLATGALWAIGWAVTTAAGIKVEDSVAGVISPLTKPTLLLKTSQRQRSVRYPSDA